MKQKVISTLEITLANIHRDVLVLMSTLEIGLVTFPGMYSYFWMWRMCINATTWTFLIFRFGVPSLWPPFIPFPLSPLHLESTLLGVKDLLFRLPNFPKHASLGDRSPESSEPYVTLDSQCSLNRTTFRVRTSFFPGSHLRVSRTYCGKNMLDVVVVLHHMKRVDGWSWNQTVRTERAAELEELLMAWTQGQIRMSATVYMSSHGNLCYNDRLHRNVIPVKFLRVSVNTLPAEHVTSNALVVR